MWHDLNVHLRAGARTIVVESRDMMSHLRVDILDAADAMTPKPYRYLEYTPFSGLVLWDDKKGWVTLIDPNSDINGIGAVASMMLQYPEPALLHLHHPQFYWRQPQQAYGLMQLAERMRDNAQAMVWSVPVGTDLPEHFRPYVVMLSAPVPDEDARYEIVEEIVESNEWISRFTDPFQLRDGIHRLAEAIRGLPEGLARTAVKYAIQKAGEDVQLQDWKTPLVYEAWAEAAEEWKSNQAQSQGRIKKIDTRTNGHNRIVGWDHFFQVIQRYADAGAFEMGHPLFPGMFVLVGPPGTAKSAVVAELSRITGLPAYDTRAEAMVGDGIVGSMEKQFAMTFKDAEMVGPCLLRMDEMEKFLGGTQSSNKSDGGTLNRSSSIMLKFLQEEAVKAGVVVIGTMNRVPDIRPEDIRTGRSEGVFFVPIPSTASRQAIGDTLLRDWVRKMNEFRRSQGQSDVQVADNVTAQWLTTVTEDMVGADIKFLLKQALVMGGGDKITRQSVLDAAENITPMRRLMGAEMAAFDKMQRRLPSVEDGRRGDGDSPRTPSMPSPRRPDTPGGGPRRRLREIIPEPTVAAQAPVDKESAAKEKQKQQLRQE